MPLPKFTVKTYKDGRQVASFRDTQGRVRTRNGPQNFARMDQIRELADYGILLQIEQAQKGLGSNGVPMKPLAPRYAVWKSKVGLKPMRNLYGLGGRPVVNTNGKKRYLRSAKHMAGRGHMLDDIRVNYLDDKKATLTISNQASRIKARANEAKAPWWGWSPDSVRKLRAKAGQLFGAGPAERCFELGIIGVSALAFVRSKFKRAA